MRAPSERRPSSPAPHVAWVVNHYARPPSRSGGTRHFELARHAAAQGWDVRLVAASTDLSSGEQMLPGRQRMATGQEQGVDFTWLRAPAYRGNGAGRILNMATFAAHAWLPAATNHLPAPDVVVGSSVHPLAVWSARALARRLRVPFVFEVRDLWPETLVAYGALAEGSVGERAMRRLVGSLYASAHRIITTMPRGYQCLEAYGVPREKVAWIPNGVDVSEFDPRPGPARGDRPDARLVLMYLGAHGQANGLDMLIDAVGLLPEDRRRALHLVLVGDGPAKTALAQRASARGLDGSVTFEPAVPRDRVPDVMARADALAFVSVDKPELYRFGMSPNKLGDYMASGRAVLAGLDYPDDPVSASGGGLVVPPTAEGLAEGMSRLLERTDVELADLGARGRAHAAEHYDFDQLARSFVDVLESTRLTSAVAR